MSPKLEEDDKSDSCKLKIYSKREKRVPLFITYFSHGEMKTNIPSELHFQCFKKSTAEQKMEWEISRNLVAANGRLTYVGNCNVSSLHYFVGVRDKISGKMKLYDCVIFRMKAKLQMINNKVEPVSKTYTEGLDALTESFGSKARKRALSLKQKYIVDSSVVKEISIHNSILQLSPSNYALPEYIDYLPPVNRIASSVNDVFDICHIISSQEDISLNIEVQELFASPLDMLTKKRFSFCKYVSMRFENVTIMKAKYLLYFNYLIVFQQLKYTDMRKKDPIPSIPDPYKKNMLEKFTRISRTNSGRIIRSCSNQLKDKLIAYILALGLVIDEFKVNLEEIVEDMSNIKVPKLTTIAKALGCYITTKKIGERIMKYAEIKIPLNVPIPKYVRRSSINKKL
ncbi:DNA-directed RNA polymerase I subunit RPA49-like [Argiope bruennichi]|uniref:DNA-directed RNA polymerase I subunit RPA49 like protein n=1 Tax=Argiope bruennichi TaxID=94029 RepID=A0A8T0G454_ARGBR|nr:DNA-directed RNA polymerase I subunit RPA49-like [Argiope bruennichi]KAF8797258.1 DNA-directed RNA polymerase I subunit RPA49 like protein [Argiope bruennichi]